MRIKDVKTSYFSGAGTFPQFSAGHRNLSCYPRPNSLPRERQFICDFRSTVGVSTVEALMRISIKMISAQHSSNNGKNWQKLSYQKILLAW